MVDQQSADPAIIKGADTIDLQEEGSHGVLLLHGFGDTPHTLSLLARRLAKRGYGVFAPLLPGHGRDMAAFQRARAEDWIDAAKSSLTRMQQRYAFVSVIGLSMGGALAVLIAADTKMISSLVLIAPSLGMPIQNRLAASMHWLRAPLAVDLKDSTPRH